MRKYTVLIVFVLAAALLAGCGSSGKSEASAPQATEAPAEQETEAALEETEAAPEEPETAPEETQAAPLVGGWAVPESFEITDEQRAAFDKATEGLLGVDYDLVACLGRQVVAGTNYALLCTGKAVSPEASLTLNVAYVYADLQGGAELLGFRGLTPNGEFTQDPLAYAGGWQVPEAEDDGLAAFEKGMEGLTGVNYVPIRVIGEQVVSGMNYCVLTQATTVYPGAAPYCALVFIYKDLSGNVEISDIRELPIPGALEL